jgi:hypothetical protein
MLLGAQSILWLFGIFYSIRFFIEEISALRAESQTSALRPITINIGFALLVALVTVILLAHKLDWVSEPIGGVTIKSTNYRIVGKIAELASALNIFAMLVLRQDCLSYSWDKKPLCDRISKIISTNRKLDTLLLLASSIFGLGVLSKVILASAHYHEGCKNCMDPKFFIGYGIVASVLMAVAYMSCRFPVFLEAKKVVYEICGNCPSDVNELKEWAEKRVSTENLLRVRIVNLSALGEGFSLAAPAIVGAISVFIKP